ncbi:bifunctional glutamate N-acetyltransferase/amino-acid acetyltransferase ArgJ [Lentisphaera profundi]|uniref:Arginine biosynthesis bifunctional protein ArgJ n=1 Tax=Lentisphaera profundi TaxID=1658616 RepID=A0ABY7VVB2_9BACT|nr:bifunctional glutamate N-acetyltransferase/amino-acid acetyltransferase ArgJ [Lentisphaera profundi]WDE98166.1 bifunctional glutamate N-acetyltransferase/amino-acid acetyltransferase ArgJ [Lentisphaera profundi]
MYTFDEKPVMPKGFTCASRNCGIKEEGDDLAIFYSEKTAEAAAVFTRNLVPGAPVIAGREIIKKAKLQAVVVNSRVSNVGTGDEGVKRAYRMSAAASEELNCNEDEVIMSSTGVIAVPLPVEKIEAGLVGMKADLCADPLVGARGIMTTDTYAKAISISCDKYTLTIVGKGSGMIEPNMATMLVYAFTDAEIAASDLDAVLRVSVNQSFNMLSIDTDTSTSDTVVAMANGLAGKVDLDEFQERFSAACIRMTEMLARDGEGASKLLKIIIEEAVDEKQAKVYARAMVNSPLIKTMSHGCDPNIGRMLMALGKCFDNDLDVAKLELIVNDVTVFVDSVKTDFDEKALRESIDSEEVVFKVKIGLGKGTATAYGCDLTHGYVDENAAYYSS